MNTASSQASRPSFAAAASIRRVGSAAGARPLASRAGLILNQSIRA